MSLSSKDGQLARYRYRPPRYGLQNTRYVSIVPAYAVAPSRYVAVPMGWEYDERVILSVSDFRHKLRAIKKYSVRLNVARIEQYTDTSYSDVKRE
jgi:hypothetical protein